MKNLQDNIAGLGNGDVLVSRKKYGSNIIVYKRKSWLWETILRILKEPMIMLLLLAATLYALNGHTGDSIFLATTVLIVAAISWFQQKRSHNALKALKDLSKPMCRVIRSKGQATINSDELVVGDVFIIEEGSIVPADGIIIESNDLTVNESLLTGESLPVSKDVTQKHNLLYRGTTITSGLAFVRVVSVGNSTRLGSIGTDMESIREELSPLEGSIRKFVSKMVLVGIFSFFVVWAINYSYSRQFLNSLLQSLTLAMSFLPEEIPVAFTTFMAMGAWRLMKDGILTQQLNTVESLGSATVICTDKTGTITKNEMAIISVYEITTGNVHKYDQELVSSAKMVVRTAMWASESSPFDPMEKALHEAYEKLFIRDERPFYQLIHEYSLGGKPPMMTHIYKNNIGQYIIAAKGAPEALLAVSDLPPEKRLEIDQVINQLGQQGYRLLGVGSASHDEKSFPKQQQDILFNFEGIIAFYDPPKENISQVMQSFYEAGISIKIITGDNAITAKAIAQSIGFQGYEYGIEGEPLMKMDDHSLEKCVEVTQLFSRMFPEAKLRVINALKRNGEIVAMVGDGVNDGSALKSAHIGIAMGKKGTEIARQAADLVLVKDDLAVMITAIATGRRINTNLKKAIRYIISIHVPIIMSVTIPLILQWHYPNILSPVHVIFMELIMGPTCSVIYENEPLEANAMKSGPIPVTKSLLSRHDLIISAIQGLIIGIAILFVYQYGVYLRYAEAEIRSLVFTVLITANIMLTLVNRSFYYSLWWSLRFKNKLIPFVIAITITLSTTIAVISPVRRFFSLAPIPGVDFIGSVLLGIISVIWFEFYKCAVRNKHSHNYSKKRLN